MDEDWSDREMKIEREGERDGGIAAEKHKWSRRDRERERERAITPA